MQRTAALAVAIGLLLASASASAKPPPRQEPLVKLDIEMPQYKPDQPLPLVTASGWSLVFKAQASTDNLGIALTEAPGRFPTLNQTSYVVFRDPDGCLALPPPFKRPQASDPPTPCDLAESDELYLQFTPDTDTYGRLDGAGDPNVQQALADPARSGEPVLDQFEDPQLDSNGEFEGPGTSAPGPLGPMTGGTVNDGVGYGADDDFTGLVVLSETGPGIVYQQDFATQQPRTLRNLAGFLSWVASTLKESNGRTTVNAGMVLPYGLVLPFMQADDCIGPPFECGGTPRFRLDGGQVQDTNVQGPLGIHQFNYLKLVRERQYRIRAFVVSGIAPSTLSDVNGDGEIDSSDASAAGYQVLSNEKSVFVRQYHDDPCAIGLQNVFFADFDGNGRAKDFLVCPGGPGQISQPPD
jgi:hypothetical protein